MLLVNYVSMYHVRNECVYLIYAEYMLIDMLHV